MEKSAPAIPFALNWGIMATGHIAKRFARDLLTDPLVRSTDDKAQGFCVEVGAPFGEVAVYSSYQELVADSAVDIVYIATPVSHHFRNAMLALEASKHVLCEKTLTADGGVRRPLRRERGVSLRERELHVPGELAVLCRAAAAGDAGTRRHAGQPPDARATHRGVSGRGAGEVSVPAFLRHALRRYIRPLTRSDQTMDNHQDRGAASGQAGHTEPPPPHSTRKETYMTFVCSHCGKREASSKPRQLWKLMQEQLTICPGTVIGITLRCLRCTYPEFIKTWVENLKPHGYDLGDNKRAPAVEMAWVVAYVEHRPELPEVDGILRGLSDEVYLLDTMGAHLIAAVRAVYGVTSPSHVALLQGSRYWSLRTTHISAREEYLGLLDSELGNLNRVQAELERLLKRGEEDDSFRISLRELNRLYSALADLYEAVVNIATMVIHTHADLWPYQQLYLTTKEFSRVQQYIRDEHSFCWGKVRRLQPKVRTFKGSLPVRELVDLVAMPGRDDSRIAFIKDIKEGIMSILFEFSDLQGSIEETEESPYPTTRKRYNFLPVEFDIESDSYRHCGERQYRSIAESRFG
ncbi:hypothetical protein PG997_000129 [Apiospora hydei]|uniref:D-xylose 1-dehydrogenase (NADP(+), D-xylono-1,5-lactone-forming) n=1 Tax=Apiospora hydei TaxID=1337664 RepID=A0ABR1X9V7_9PEZI